MTHTGWMRIFTSFGRGGHTLGLVVVMAMLATGCGSFLSNAASAGDEAKTLETTQSPENDFGKDATPITAAPDPVDAPDPIDPPDTIEPVDPPDDGITRRVVSGARSSTVDQILLVEQFWAQVDTEIGFEYVPLDNDRLFTRSALERGEEQTCAFDGDSEPIDPDEVAENAFVAPCDEGITVVWDNLELGTDLEQRFPGAGIAMLLAHEWGHVVQFQRSQFEQNDLIAEQQADCYSGAYARWAEDRALEPFTSAQALDFAIISTLEARDAVGARPDEIGAHGNGFDRIRATQEGYDRGVSFCDNYDITPPPVTQMGFVPGSDDELNEGNLPYAPAFELLVPAVTEWYESLSVEALEPLVDLPSEVLLRELVSEIGDASLLAEYSLRYGAALQQSIGDETSGEGGALQRACLTGAYLQDALTNGLGDDGTGTNTAAGSLSPGDLDEVIMTLASSDELLSNPGLVFEMVAALRVGTLEGLPACNLA
jgi:hypothetical protein